MLSQNVFSEAYKKGFDSDLIFWGVGLVGLDLLNNDTRPSGHISRPTQVNMSQELLSFSKLLLKFDHMSGG